MAGALPGAPKKRESSIAAAVSALSRELGVDLTERVGRGVGLTSAGNAFRPYAADVLGLIDQGKKAAREAAKYHFDYANLSEFERKYAREGRPFYAIAAQKKDPSPRPSGERA